MLLPECRAAARPWSRRRRAGRRPIAPLSGLSSPMIRFTSESRSASGSASGQASVFDSSPCAASYALGRLHDGVGGHDLQARDALHEVGHVVVRRIRDDVLGRADLNHFPVLHDCDPGAHAYRLVEVVGDDEDLPVGGFDQPIDVANEGRLAGAGETRASASPIPPGLLHPRCQTTGTAIALV